MPSIAPQLEPVRVRCQTCGAEITVSPELLTGTCPYCASPAVVDRPETADRPDPDFALPFVVDRERAATRVRAWVRRRWFTPKGLAKAAFEHVQGIYVPTYLYNAVAHSEWDAQIGENYTETQTVRVRTAKGWTTQRRTVVKTEHHRLRGRFATYLIDVVVSASGGVSNEELEALEPFDLRALVRYDPGLVSGWIAEEPQLTREACLKTAHDEGRRLVGRNLATFMPGDSHHGLEHRTTLSDEEVSLALVPVWVFALRRAPELDPVRIVVNGQTGQLYGQVPRSGGRIFLFVLAILLALGICFLAALAVGAMLSVR